MPQLPSPGTNVGWGKGGGHSSVGQPLQGWEEHVTQASSLPLSLLQRVPRSQRDWAEASDLFRGGWISPEGKCRLSSRPWEERPGWGSQACCRGGAGEGTSQRRRCRLAQKSHLQSPEREGGRAEPSHPLWGQGPWSPCRSSEPPCLSASSTCTTSSLRSRSQTTTP